MLERHRAQVGTSEDAHAVHRLGSLGSHEPELLDAQRVDEVLRAAGVDGAQSVRLALVAGNLGEELVVAHSRRGGEVEALLDLRLYLSGDVNGEGYARLVVGHVEERLVERDGLHKLGVLMENGMHLPRHLLIHLVTARHNYQVGAHALGKAHRHRRVHAKGARLVARCGHHASLAVVPNGDGLATQLGVVALLHRREKGVHVDVYNLALGHNSRAKIEKKWQMPSLNGAQSLLSGFDITASLPRGYSLLCRMVVGSPNKNSHLLAQNGPLFNAKKHFFCQIICQLKKLHYLCNRFSSPDGGIGRRAGLKHQWGNTRAGSTPALGTALNANRLNFKWLAFLLLFLATFWRDQEKSAVFKEISKTADFSFVFW